jgi:hypothetical protein
MNEPLQRSDRSRPHVPRLSRGEPARRGGEWYLEVDLSAPTRDCAVTSYSSEAMPYGLTVTTAPPLVAELRSSGDHCH